MSEVQLQLNKRNQGAFIVQGEPEQSGEMYVGVDSKYLIVYHTEVSKAAEGKGFAKQLLNAMVAHARQHKLKVIALCPYTLGQFQRHPELYEDVWQKKIPLTAWWRINMDRVFSLFSR